MECGKNVNSSTSFYEDLDEKISNDLSKLHEMLDNVLVRRANCRRLMLDLKLIYNRKYLQELYTLTEDDEAKDVKRYIDMVKDLANTKSLQSHSTE